MKYETGELPPSNIRSSYDTTKNQSSFVDTNTTCGVEVGKLGKLLIYSINRKKFKIRLAIHIFKFI